VIVTSDTNVTCYSHFKLKTFKVGLS